MLSLGHSVMAATVMGRPGPGAEGAFLEYGNVALPARGTISNAPQRRRFAVIGDSRASGNSPVQFAGQVLWASGVWIWADSRTYDYALGGSSIYHAVNTQAPAALADGCRVFVVLTGTNGARQNGEGDGVDTFATRRTETLNLLAALDVPGATIILCNEMPGRSGNPGTDQAKVDHHNWLNTLTTASAGLVNADLVIANTWDAVSDGGNGTDTELDAQWANDGLHPAAQGQERQAKAVWDALNGHFGNSVQLDFASPAQNLMDGTTTTTNGAGKRAGLVPTGWQDSTADDGLTYSTTGTGLDTEVTVHNPGPSDVLLFPRIGTGAFTDGVLLVDYSFNADPDADPAQGGAPNFWPRLIVRDVDFGTGANQAITGTAVGSAQVAAQDYQMGGMRRGVVYLGASGPSPRVDPVFSIAAGQSVTFHRLEIHERSLIVNGEFLDGAAGWVDTSSAGGSATVVNEQLVLENATGTARGNQSVDLTPGVEYVVGFTASGPGAVVYDSPSVSVGNTLAGENTIVFTASGEADRIDFRNFTVGTTVIIGNVTLRRNA